MKPMLHCLWTGPSFPYGVRSFIKRWVTYLRHSKSDFELVLWVTDDSLTALESFLKSGLGNCLESGGWKRCMAGCDVLFKKASINLCTFYIARCEEQLAKYPADLKTMFNLLYKGKRYTTVSNIGRLMAVNACGGIYTDIDYLSPVEGTYFPQNMLSIIDIFEHCSKIEFYLPTIDLRKKCLIENQCLILAEQSIGRLTPLIRDMSQQMISQFATICAETKDNATFASHPITKDLNKSKFMDGLFRDLLEAYKARDSTAFDQINKEIFKNEYYEGVSLGITGYAVKGKVPMLIEGDRHDSYRETGKATYSIVATFFNDNLRTNLYEYTYRYWSVFLMFFDKKVTESQFVFKDKSGELCGMYSWANPGYSRLRALENSARTFEKKYIEKKRLILKSLLVFFFEKVEIECHSFLEEGRMKIFDCLCNAALGLKRNYLTPEIARGLLKDFLSIAFIQVSIAPAQSGMVATDILNEDEFIQLKEIIDPDIDVLNYEDIKAFARF